LACSSLNANKKVLASSEDIATLVDACGTELLQMSQSTKWDMRSKLAM